MIFEMHHELAELMIARKFPLQFVYGPTVVKSEGYPGGVVVVERDRTRGDTVRAVTGSQDNPKKYRNRDLSAELRVYARSTVEGAHVGNHEQLCEQIVDALIVSLIEWGAKAVHTTDIPVVESRYLSAEERDDVETWPGVVYLLRITVPRAVFKKDFTGAARPTGTVTGITRITTARLAGGSEDTEDTGCSNE